MKPNRTSSLTPAEAEALQARFAQRLSARLDDSTRQLPHDITERLRVARQQAVAAAQAQRGLAARPAAQASVVTVASPAGLALAGAGGSSLAGGAYQGAPRRGGRLDDHGGGSDDRTSWPVRLASLLPLLALLAGLWGINHWAHREQVQAAAEVDTALLTDDLPPAAYADPGFEEYLLSSEAAASSIDPAPTGGPEAVTPGDASPGVDSITPPDAAAAG